MLPSWFRQTVTRIRPGTMTSRGSVIPDWSNTDTLDIDGCSVQPSATTLSQDGRVFGISESMTLYMPAAADVQEGDRIVYDGNTFVVSGVARSWMSASGALDNKQATLERWDG